VTDHPWIVCGFYTPDYRRWWDRLRPTLEQHGAPHDFVEAEKRSGGWEINTMEKPRQVLAAMERNPDKAIIFLDVDCEVRGSLEPLSRIRGDVSFHIRTKRKKTHAKWGGIRSGTLVIRPTPEARKFAALWASQASLYGDVDQNTLMFAVCDATDCTFQPLPVIYCATRRDKLNSPVIFHDSASAGIEKIGQLGKHLQRMGAPLWIVKAMPGDRTYE
jgi:hypothetical protein